MPKFTITKDGRAVAQVEAHGDRIELGSARTCQVIIDDLLISLKQAAFVKSPGGTTYAIEPVSRVPAMTVNGVPLSDRADIADGSVVGIEGYTITINYTVGEMGAKPPAPAELRPSPPPQFAGDPPLPPPLEPELPPPLEPIPPAAVAPLASPVVTVPSDNADMERTVFVRRIGRVVAVSGPLSGKSWDLKSGETRIGREQGQNDIVVRFDAQGNVDNSVSRRHASIHVMGDRVFVEDAGSAAGTFVNGKTVPPRQRVEVRANDQIEIRSSRESTVLRIELERSAVPTPPPAVAAAPAPAPVQTPIIQPEPVRIAPSPPVHEPEAADLRGEDPPIARRRRRSEGGGESIFVPEEETGKGGRIPKWGWILAGAGVILLIAILLLIAL